MCAASTGYRARRFTSGRRSSAASTDAKRLKALENKNARLKKLLAVAIMKGINGRKW
jgi:hypothetical protein